jgi:hypothetical protein
VFFRLGKLQPGDQIAVSRADETTAAFTVDAVHRYPKDGGAFDHTKRSYEDIVVFASITDGNTRGGQLLQRR